MFRSAPQAKRFHDGIELEVRDDEWFIDEVENGRVKLSNDRTDHILRVKPDHIHNFSNTLKDGYGFLSLTAQVCLEGVNVRIEPNVWLGEFPMATRPEQVFDFLSKNRGGFYCDDCIRKALSMPKVQAVEQITATLALCSGFTRAYELCHACKSQHKLAIKAN
jgi:hypothetical protein